MPVVAFLSMVGPSELLIILAIVLIVFGAGRLPQVLEQMGKGVKAFRDAQKDESIDVTRTARPRELADLDEADELEAREKQKAASKV